MAVLIIGGSLAAFLYRTHTPDEATDRYVEYVPVIRTISRGDHLLVDAPELLTSRHVTAIQQVLGRYDEPFRLRGGKVYIQRTLSADRDLLANFSEKAQEQVQQLVTVP